MSESAERLARYRIGALRAEIEGLERYRSAVDAAIEEYERKTCEVGRDLHMIE
jgi:N-methylhydantoinase B/oxoprolinase/acetone carboxylase alpha subunit